MKFCTLVEIDNGQVAGIVDISLVSDDHHFGLSDNDTRLHIESVSPVETTPWPTPAPGAMPGSLASLRRTGGRERP